MKPWEENWNNFPIEENKNGAAVMPWQENWQESAEIELNAQDYNGTALLSTPGENSRPFEKMRLFMDKLFTFEVKTGDEVKQKIAENPRIQALKKIRQDDITEVKWSEVGKSVTRESLRMGKGLTSAPFKIYGDWTRDERDISLLSSEEAQKVKYNNFIADCYTKVGGYIEKMWDLGLNSEWLKEDEKIFAGSFVENPSLTRVLSLGGGAIPSILYGGGIAKITGSPTLAALALSGVDAEDIYWGAREKGKSQNEALALYAAGAGGTAVFEKYGLDRIYENKIMPLGKRIVTSVLSEGLTEGMQTSYQNMVKKYGYDDTQNLMEGVIESMIGGAIGGGVVSGTYGGYVKLQQARESLKEKGLSDENLDIIQEGFAEEIAKHRDTIEPMFQQNINKSMSTLEKFIAENEGTAEAQKALQTKQELEQIYTDVSERLKKVGVAENVANADAKIWQGIALWGSQELGVSPAEYMKRMPKIESMTYEQFQNRGKTLEEELNDYIPYQLPAEAYNKQGKADVNSEAFKRWFGDSKVVDEDGQPLVVYHGTNMEFDTFDRRKANRLDHGFFGAGFYFAKSPQSGKAMARNANIDMPLYLKMDNPFYFDMGDTTSIIDKIKKEYKIYAENYNKSVVPNERIDTDADIDESFFDRNGNINGSYNHAQRFTSLLQDIGYDGVIVNNGEEYIAFEPNQIKSVDNRGTFDPNNDNIYYQGVKASKLDVTTQTEPKLMRNEARKYLKDVIRKQNIAHPELGKIRVSNKGINEFMNATGNLDKIALIPHLKELIETSTVGIKENLTHPRADGIVAFYSLYNEATIDGKNYKVTTKIGVDENGNLFYTLLMDEAKENLSSNKPTKGKPTQAESPQNTSVERGNEGKETDNPVYDINITPTRENVNKTLYQDRDVPKGAYMQNLDRTGIIYLFEKANASTFMHETAHFFRKELQSFDTVRSREMLKKVDEWENNQFDQRYKIQEQGSGFVVTDSLGNVIYGAEQPFFNAETAREYGKNEIFARGFEQYLRESKAPSNYLKQAFRSFWNWLRHLYKAALDLNVELNDSIRSVYGDIIGGKDLDFYLSAPTDEVLQQHFAENEDRKKIYEEQIALAQAQPIKRNFTANLARERTDGAKGRNEWWNKAVVPISTRAKRVNIKLRNKLRAYDYDLNTKLNQYYAQIKPFLDKWATMTEADAMAFDLALKNSYVEKQIEIVKKYNAYDEFVEVKNLLNSLFDQAIDVGIEMGYSADYFPRQIEDVEGFMAAMYGSPFSSQLRRALREADPDNVMTNEQRAEFFNKYLRGFNRRDLNKPLPGNTKDRSIDIVTAEMNKYYKPSMQALINYIEGMNTSIESRKFWGFKSDDINQSIGALTADLVDTGVITPEQDAEVQAILRARFKAKGVTNKWLNLQKNVSYIYTMGGLNSAITQLDDISMSLYKAGLWNTVQSVLRPNRPGLSREELGLERIGQEFVEASTSSQAVSTIFKLTGLDKIDAFGKNTLINATFNKFQKMAKNNEAELRARIEPVMEQETEQTIEDIKNGVISENVKLLMFNELADVQPIALSEMPEWYLTSGNGRVFYMLKTFMLKRLDIFRNESFDRMRQGDVKTGMQNLFRLAILMILSGAAKDAIIDMMFGRDFDVTDTMVNNLLGLAGISKYTLYKARDEGFSGFASSFLIPPVFASSSDLLSDIYKSLFSKKGKDIKDYEIWKGIPLIGRFYYWWFGGGRTKENRKKKKKLK